MLGAEILEEMQRASKSSDRLRGTQERSERLRDAHRGSERLTGSDRLRESQRGPKVQRGLEAEKPENELGFRSGQKERKTIYAIAIFWFWRLRAGFEIPGAPR